MPRKKFIAYDIVGTTIWGAGISLLGFWLGRKIPNIDSYILPIILIAVAISFGPALWHLVSDKKIRAKILSKLKNSKTD